MRLSSLEIYRYKEERGWHAAYFQFNLAKSFRKPYIRGHAKKRCFCRSNTVFLRQNRTRRRTRPEYLRPPLMIRGRVPIVSVEALGSLDSSRLRVARSQNEQANLPGFVREHGALLRRRPSIHARDRAPAASRLVRGEYRSSH